MSGVLLCLGLPILAGCTGSRASHTRLWQAFNSRFVTSEGRIVDIDNGGISHSEGQGWGLLFALAGGDAAAFRRIWSWTSTALRQREDALFSWRYDPRSKPPVQDRNNATDGDIFIAWALGRAAQRFGEPRWQAEAERIRADLLTLCTVEQGQNRYLLPGAEGFRKKGRLVLNPSYFVFPAFAAFMRETEAQAWRQVDRTALRLLESARFGPYGLPADWVSVDLESDLEPGDLAPAPEFPPRFGFEAIRIPLYIAWRFRPDSPRLAPFAAYMSANAQNDPLPAWQDLESGERAPYPLSPGAMRVLALATGDIVSARDDEIPKDGYYSSALAFLAALAADGFGLGGEV